MKIVLFFYPKTRATRVRWMLEEVGADYTLQTLDVRGGENRQPPYLAIHPQGKVPALTIDGRPMIESGAICGWLADAFPGSGLAPALDAPERADYMQWLFYASATLEPALGELFMAKRKGESGEAQAAALVPMVAFAERALADRPWLTGEAFSAADVILASSFQWLRAMEPEMLPAMLSDYSTRAFARPAARRAIAI
jgi:glutathione S-transferase